MKRVHKNRLFLAISIIATFGLCLLFGSRSSETFYFFNDLYFDVSLNKCLSSGWFVTAFIVVLFETTQRC